MICKFHNGPYDGIELDHNDINLYCRFTPVGIRKFVLMPPIQAWDSVRQGEIEKNGPFDGDQSFYELIGTGDGMIGQHDADGSVFAAAMKEYKEGKQPVPKVELTGQHYTCLRGDDPITLEREDMFTVTDEKDREWLCYPGESGPGFSVGATNVVILHCESEDLPRELTDVID